MGLWIQSESHGIRYQLSKFVWAAQPRIQTVLALCLLGCLTMIGGCALTSGANGSISPSSLSISTPTLPQGQLQSQYQASLSASGGKEPYTWRVLSGTLPSGLSLTASSGTISGTPTQSGDSTFTVGVEDASSPIATAKESLRLTIGSAKAPLQVSTGNLPTGAVLQRYAASLSANGGTSPYKWSLYSGQLPTGLTLSTTGAISGMPTTVGPKSFTVQVKDSSSPATIAKAALTLDVVSKTVGLQVVTSVLPSGTVKTSYAASLSASGGTGPYKWVISSGTLPAGLVLNSSGSITGMPTTASKDSFSVRVTDSSSPAQTATASLQISIGSSQIIQALQISNAALPSGIAQISYAANLSVTGGTAPYTWNITSGQLPSGLSLSVNGQIAGTPTTTGQASFTVDVMDSSSPRQTATHSFSISIAAQSQGGGPYTSRTDHNFIPLPSPLPSVGGATGAGKCISQPGYNNLVCRATDIDTLGVGNTNVFDQEFSTCCGGWADSNDWNTNSTMFFAVTNGDGLVVMSFNPATHAVAPLYGQPLLSFAGGWWSYKNPQLAYSLENGTKDPVIVSMTISSQTTPPQPAVIADLSKVPNCVSALAGHTEWEELAVSRDEQTFAVAAGTGIQGSAIYVIVYNRSNGCRWFNTQTGQIGGNWGIGGPAVTLDRYTIHSVRISEDGQTVIVTPTNGSGAGSAFRHFWNTSGLAVTAGTGDASTGHFVAGYSGYINNASLTANDSWCKYGMAYRTLANFLSPFYVLPTLAACGDTKLQGDDHSSWNNDDTSDHQPFFTSTVTIPAGTPITTAWQDEVLGFSMTNPGTVWRFMSTYITGTSQFFSCQQGIGTVSQDGKWFVFTSDWGNTLGIDNAGSNRCDVFVGQLK